MQGFSRGCDVKPLEKIGRKLKILNIKEDSGMANINVLKRQHEDIHKLIEEIKGTIELGNLEDDAANIAKQISILAGKLKMHLGTEDQFMYPELLNSSNLEIRNMAQQYIEEMGNLSAEFAVYKDKYNTRTKILSDKEGFLKETERIFKLLAARVEKEDKYIYPLVEG